MNEFINKEMSNFNLNLNPSTKQLLINYIHLEYEENADCSDDSLMREWWFLYENNLLALLFTAEGLNANPL